MVSSVLVMDASQLLIRLGIRERDVSPNPKKIKIKKKIPNGFIKLNKEEAEFLFDEVGSDMTNKAVVIDCLKIIIKAREDKVSLPHLPKVRQEINETYQRYRKQHPRRCQYPLGKEM